MSVWHLRPCILWRDDPKVWELLSGQVASPLDSRAPLRQGRYSSKHVPRTYGNSWFYLNGKPLTCSLCTAPVCVDCSKVFRWGDQFRREACPCGGALEMRRVTAPDVSSTRRVLKMDFERRCGCCGALETLKGLQYVSVCAL